MQLSENRRLAILSVDTCDPKRLIRDALAGPGDGWSPKDLYLAWLINLPVEIDAADAAALLLERADRPDARDAAAQDLVALLEKTTGYPRERLEPDALSPSALH